MMKMISDSPVSAPSSSNEDLSSTEDVRPGSAVEKPGFFSRLKTLFSSTPKQDSSLREAIEEYIVEEADSFETDSVSTHERVLLSNILNLRDERVQDVMIPRADIAAIEVNSSVDDVFALLAERQFSRLPVYHETLDEVLGTVHIKDILATLAQKKEVVIKDLVTEIPIVSPALPVLDLVLEMRHTRRHMALVVDEFGGIDGLVTIGDVIGKIIGEIDDEHDTELEPQLIEQKDGAVIADARVDLDEFEDQYGKIFDSEEHEESDTLGGLVFALAGRVPVRGEILEHPSGMEFEIIEADPRRISTLKIRNIPDPQSGDATATERQAAE